MTRNTYIALGLLVFAGMVSFGSFAKANPSYFVRCQTASATTTVAYMSPGAATTTLTMPSSQCNMSGVTAVDSAILHIQYTASSTGPTLVFRVEHSQDGVDWYPETVALAANATSTQLSGDSATYKWIMATSTDNGGSGTSARLMRSYTITTPTAYTRVIFSVPASGGNGALWASLVAKEQAS